MAVKVQFDKGVKDKLIAGLNKSIGNKRKEVAELVMITALNVEREAKLKVRVKSGRLRSSIHIMNESMGGTNVDVGTNVDYAEKIERRVPYLFPALESQRNDFISNLEKILSQWR